VLNISHLTVAFNNHVILDDLSLTVTTGTVQAITGPSGIGKSTLLRAVCGLVRISHGVVSVNNTDVTRLPTHKRGIGLMAQGNDLFPTMSVARNVAFGLSALPLSPREKNERVSQYLEMVRLPHLADRGVHQLSGGEARRVALARALAPQPQVLLLDEPLTGLDEEVHDALAHDLSRLLSATSTTSLLVTHDESEAHIIAPFTQPFRLNTP
jgi:thiamine transport system ATP-binding protein